MYYLYERWHPGPHKTMIHDGTCGFCNDGTGKTGTVGITHGRWHGPFETLTDARTASDALGGVRIRSECRCLLKTVAA